MDIIMAEDELVSAALLKKILETAGHKVIEAKNGAEAWNLFLKYRTRIVISDWNMPEMTGLDLCEKIRAEESNQYTYIILLTANDNISDIYDAFDVGVDDYLIKPVESIELIARIRAGERILQLEENSRRMHSQLLQSEKMASVGQLAAGVAHEINNPTGFVSSNLSTLSGYQKDINGLIGGYRRLISNFKELVPKGGMPASIVDQLDELKELESEIDLDFIIEDIDDLIGDCREGTERIKKIVIDLKDFAHPGEDEMTSVDINKGLESTLNVVNNEIKYKAEVIKDLGAIPLVEGYPQQMNQVFMNILVNAAQAIEERGEIRVETRSLDGNVEVLISDTGLGIPEENLSKIFDPFFTTKEVGKGTGLGMNVAYNIIKKHNGIIDIESTVGKGTTFIIRIPADS